MDLCKQYNAQHSLTIVISSHIAVVLDSERLPEYERFRFGVVVSF